jgi:hypothetical protein
MMMEIKDSVKNWHSFINIHQIVAITFIMSTPKAMKFHMVSGKEFSADIIFYDVFSKLMGEDLIDISKMNRIGHKIN